GLLDDEPLAELGVLRRHADRATARVAVVALAGGDADRALVVGDAGDLLVAVERHQRGVSDRDGGRAEREALGHVGALADAAGGDRVALVGQPALPRGAGRPRGP